MTHATFRKLALALAGASEGAHMGHPDFRAYGRIFATLHADLKTAMVKLMPEQQAEFVRASTAFTPENGAWGRQGCTRIVLATADTERVGEALTCAWQNAAVAARTKRRASTRPRPVR